MRAWKRGNRRGEDDAWRFTYRDPDTGRERTVTASPDVETTVRQMRDISRMLDQRRLGQITDRDARAAAYATQPIVEHLDAYKTWLLAKGRTPKQAKEVYSRCKTMIELCEWKTLGDVEATELELAVAETVRGEWDSSLKTCNDYLKAPRQWCRWMARPKIGRLRTNPLAEVEMYNAQTDPRHERRALSVEQFQAVLAVTRGRPEYVTRVGPPQTSISGEDRAIYYLVKVHTGLRNEEAASLSPESFTLDGPDPRVTVEAAYSKHRRRDEIPITPALVAELRKWLAGKPAGQKLWALDKKPYLMWKADLQAAGIPYRLDGKYADLYALRHTFATLVGQQVDSIKDLQDLMRHSDIRLTARYMHPTLAGKRQALDGLPAMPPPAARLRATGTDDASADAQRQTAHTVRFRLGHKSDKGESPSTQTQEGQRVGLNHGPSRRDRWRRSTEPKVSGSSPERCVSQPDDPEPLGGASDALKGAPLPPSAAPGAAPPGPEAAPLPSDSAAQAELPTLEQIARWLSEIQRRQEGGAG